MMSYTTASHVDGLTWNWLGNVGKYIGETMDVNELKEEIGVNQL